MRFILLATDLESSACSDSLPVAAFLAFPPVLRTAGAETALMKSHACG